MKLLGLKIRTTNENGQAMQDISALWQRFMSTAIPNKLNDKIYVAYYEYEKDFTKPYSCLIGYEVADETPIPEGCATHTLPEANYQIFETKGPLPHSIIDLWQEIWKTPLNRSYQTDFEVYHPGSPVAEIHIGISQ